MRRDRRGRRLVVSERRGCLVPRCMYADVRVSRNPAIRKMPCSEHCLRLQYRMSMSMRRWGGQILFCVCGVDVRLAVLLVPIKQWRGRSPKVLPFVCSSSRPPSWILWQMNAGGRANMGNTDAGSHIPYCHAPW